MIMQTFIITYFAVLAAIATYNLFMFSVTQISLYEIANNYVNTHKKED